MGSAADNYGGQEDVNDLYAARSTDLGNTWTFTVIHRGEIEHTYTTDDGSPEVGGEHYSLVAAAADQSDPRYVYGAARVGHASRAAPVGRFGKVPLRSGVATSTDGGRPLGPTVGGMRRLPRSELLGSCIPAVTVGRGGGVVCMARER